MATMPPNYSFLIFNSCLKKLITFAYGMDDDEFYIEIIELNEIYNFLFDVFDK